MGNVVNNLIQHCWFFLQTKVIRYFFAIIKRCLVDFSFFSLIGILRNRVECLDAAGQ